jgi:hypothetical protein
MAAGELAHRNDGEERDTPGTDRIKHGNWNWRGRGGRGGGEEKPVAIVGLARGKSDWFNFCSCAEEMRM